MGSYATNKLDESSAASQMRATNGDLEAGAIARPVGVSSGMATDVGNGAPAEDPRVV